jgi:hypothetical protein
LFVCETMKSSLPFFPPPRPFAGAGHADAPGDRDGVRRRRGAFRPDLQRREVQRGRGEEELRIAFPFLIWARARFLCKLGTSCETMVLAFDVFFLQARYFFQQLICGVSYCHFMVRKEQTTDLYFFFLQRKQVVTSTPLLLVPATETSGICSKSATETSS